VRYGWTDSSPQANFDWVWIQSKSIAEDCIIASCDVAKELTSLFQEQLAAVGFAQRSPLRALSSDASIVAAFG
jgi:hypothetical protein